MRCLSLSLVCLAGCTGVIGSSGASNADSTGPDKPAEPGVEFRCDDPAVADPGPTLVRRLTNPEYVATVQAAVGVDVTTEAAELLPADVRADGFSNTSAALVASLAHIQAYETIAKTAVERIPDFESFLTNYVDCRVIEDACIEAFISEVGLRLFRAPVAVEERTSLQAVFNAVAAEDGTFEEGARLALEAMLQSPRFLYRVEPAAGAPGSIQEVSPHELASRLAYLVWQAPPDEALLDAASNGSIAEVSVIEAEVQRMLQDERARAAARRYVTDWLDLDRLEGLPRSAELFPEWDPSVGADMREETLAVFDWLVWDEERPLADLFSVQRTYVTRRLAEHYGLPSPQDGSQWYELADVPERGGLLTQGAIHTIGGDEASMVSRGLFLLKSVLCGDLAAPPPGVDTTPTEAEPGRSQRFYAEERVANPSCGGCHAQMEPLAFGIERFDATGAYADVDHFGNDLRQDGSVIFPGGSATPTPYSNVAELMTLLAGSDRVRDCMSLKVSQWAVGRPIADTDGCSMSAIRDRFVAGGGTYQELMVAIALSPMVRQIRVEE